MANTNQLVLRALQYDKEFLASDEDVNCKKFRQLVSWIEDAKIRLYKVEDRASLRDFSDKAWNQTFEKYLKALECSYNSTDGRVLQWLLNYALSLEYRDNEIKLNAIKVGDIPDQEIQRKPKGEVFDDVSSAGTHKILLEMASKLGISTDGLDEKKVLEKVEQVVTERSRAASNYSGILDVNTNSVPLGFSVGDPQVDNAALVLRSLYIQDLRKLQTTIDETLVQVQEFTANPKTDSKLGRVGR